MTRGGSELPSRRETVGAIGAVLLSAGCGRVISASAPGLLRLGPGIVNLGDYARGDGSDETDAVQRAVDDLPPVNAGEHRTFSHPGGLLYVPRPAIAYGISRTIRFVEKWNTTVRCEAPVSGTRGMPRNHYFQWVGRDGGTMFEFRSCKGMRVESLSMTGMDAMELERLVAAGFAPIGRHTRGVIGVRLGPETGSGFESEMLFDQLEVRDVDVGVQLGTTANNGPDVRDLVFRACVVGPFARYGVYACSANLANTTFEGLHTYAAAGASACVRVEAGDLLLVNYASNSTSFVSEADLSVVGGGVHVVKAWSEVRAPFLRAVGTAPETSDATWGSINYPMILDGVRHYDGSFLVELLRKCDPVPLSIVYDKPVPLHLRGCSLWGSVELGATSEAPVLDEGTVFINRRALGFVGEGVTRYHRVVRIGASKGDNPRVLEPYLVDRRNQPGTGPPTGGVWRKGDGIVNVDPDPAASAKAFRGWICVEDGEPGRWVPYGALSR